MLSSHLLSIHLLSASLSPHLLSNSFTINSVAFTFICYQASVAINNFVINHNLLSNFRLALNQYFSVFFHKNPPKKWKNFSKFGILQFLANFSWAWSRLVLLPQVKVQNLLKDSNNYLYFHYKDKVNNTQATYSFLSIADLKKMVQSYDNMPLGIYMNNIVRFFQR